MSRFDRIHNIISNFFIVLYCLLTVCLCIFTFLPFKNGENYYQFFSNAYDGTLYHPIVTMLLPILALIFASFSKKFPITSIVSFICLFSFSLYVALPRVMEALGYALSMRQKEDLPVYGIGETLLTRTLLCILFFTAVFAIYGIIIQICKFIKLFLNKKNNISD